MASLIKESDSGNAVASDKLAKLGGLEQMEAGLELSVVDFRDMCEGCPKLESPPIVADLAE
jgi:hypothetical protein